MSIPRYDPSFTMEELTAAQEAFFKAGRAYWEAFHKFGGHGAVVWIEGGPGVVIYSRGEYTETLIQNIHRLGPVNSFGGVEV